VLLFSDMNFQGGDALGPPARIQQLTPPTTLDVFVGSSGSNGLALLPDGTLIAATHDTRSLSLLDPRSGARTDLTIRYDGKRFSSPNDLAVRSDGLVYFTDPAWQLGARTREISETGVYRVGPALTPKNMLEAQAIDLTLDRPNGVALSPDERTLYVGSAGDEVWRYDVAADGSVSGRKLFARVGGSDGMTVDCAGNLYVASQTVEVFAPSGERLGEIRSDEGPTNVAFGGADRKTLYITAETGLYAIALGVPGFPY
jgi:gluconolactonase